MIFNYQSHSLKPGIYKITNVHTGRIYIGQAKRFKERWNDHKRHLMYGTHSNKFLQNDFSKCKAELGHDDFLVFEVIEVIEGSTKEQRCAREEVLIQEVWDQCVNCYNIRKDTSSKDRTCFSRTPEETAKLISENSKKYWSDPEWRATQVEKIRLNSQKEEYKAKLSATSKLTWSFDEFKTSQKEKLKEAWTNRTKEERKQQMEKARAAIEEKREKEKTLQGIVVSPEGIEYEVYHVRTFLKEHGIENNRKQFRMVLQGTRNICKGWTLKK